MANADVKTMILRVDMDASGAIININDLNAQLKAAGTSANQLGRQMADLGKKTANTGGAAGIAGAAVTELGRTISDAPYGIQGMANNISQLGSMFSLLVSSAGGAKNAISEMIKVMKGPVGFLIFFQTVVAAIEYFSKTSMKAAKDVSTLEESVAKAGVALKLAKNALEDDNVALEEKQEIVDALNNKYPDWNIQLDESGNISEKNAKQIDKEIDALARLAKAKAYQGLIEEAYAEQAKLSAGFAERNNTVLGKAMTIFKGYGSFVRGAAVETAGFIKKNAAIEERIKNLTEKLKDDNLVDLLIDGPGKKKKKKKETREKVKEVIGLIYDTTFAELEKRKKDAEKMLKRLGIASIEDQILQNADSGKGAIEKLKEVQELRKLTTEESLMMTQDVIGGFADFMSSEADREIDVETNRTNRINEKLRERLRNENLTAKERQAINNRIAKNDAKLVQKQNEIEEKRFKQQKAANLANALINTYLAASQALANPMNLDPISKSVAVAATIAMGLMQVAAIARQQFVARTTGGGGGRGGGGGGGANGGRGTSVFNVVGASELNQVAAAVAGQQEDPIRAYVVASEVSTVQELDRNIVSEASIG